MAAASGSRRASRTMTSMPQPDVASRSRVYCAALPSGIDLGSAPQASSGTSSRQQQERPRARGSRAAGEAGGRGQLPRLSVQVAPGMTVGAVPSRARIINDSRSDMTEHGSIALALAVAMSVACSSGGPRGLQNVGAPSSPGGGAGASAAPAAGGASAVGVADGTEGERANPELPLAPSGPGISDPEAGGAGAGNPPPFTCAAPPPPSEAFTVDAGGVTFTVNGATLRLQVCKEDIIRVAYTSAPTLPDKSSLSISNSWEPPPPFCVTEAMGIATITTAQLKTRVNELTGVVTFSDADDNVILAEDSKRLTAATVEGVNTFRVETVFNSPADEALFGLGQHQDSVMNLKGARQHLENVNTQINLPLLVSNRGYGVFWDNYSRSDFTGNDTNNTKYRYVSEAGDLVDYYFFYGRSIDRVIALYRTATGAAPMFPKWAYGLFQSKDHYTSAAELLAVKDAYRNNQIPVDVVVQDWQYWTPFVWGSHLMDPSRYADPAALVNEMHDDHVHLMISVWPLYQTTGTPQRADELDNFNQLQGMGALYPTLTANGVYHFYDTFNPGARTLVYQQIYDRLLGNYGWDAIWADNTEPQSYPEGVNVHAADTFLGKGALNLNAYPLQHSRALYEGWRNVGPDEKRVFVLTRSAFSGQQRYATACWSGDINCDFPTFARQIPGGLNYALAGMPYWTTDIGGYFGAGTNWGSPAGNELFTRWFQFGAFCPMFRIHGQGARELYNNVWTAETKANLIEIDRLRYRLMPYIYSLAWKVTNEGYTIMRHLVFDYPQDSSVFEIKDQFMFGPALLVSPVITAGATSRTLYLPAGTWYDFWTGSSVIGGSSMSVNAPLSTIPLFVRAGSIVPMGPNIQYAAEAADPLEIRVYRGADGAFTLYEDEGDTYAYERGEHSEIPFNWNESAGQLTIGARVGSYPGIRNTRTLNIVWVGANHGNSAAVVAAPDQVVNYDGSVLVLTSP
jgi:alpha-D-xyloside xylohydrolase